MTTGRSTEISAFEADYLADMHLLLLPDGKPACADGDILAIDGAESTYIVECSDFRNFLQQRALGSPERQLPIISRSMPLAPADCSFDLSAAIDTKFVQRSELQITEHASQTELESAWADHVARKFFALPNQLEEYLYLTRQLSDDLRNDVATFARYGTQQILAAAAAVPASSKLYALRMTAGIHLHHTLATVLLALSGLETIPAEEAAEFLVALPTDSRDMALIAQRLDADADRLSSAERHALRIVQWALTLRNTQLPDPNDPALHRATALMLLGIYRYFQAAPIPQRVLAYVNLDAVTFDLQQFVPKNSTGTRVSEEVLKNEIRQVVQSTYAPFPGITIVFDRPATTVPEKRVEFITTVDQLIAAKLPALHESTAKLAMECRQALSGLSYIRGDPKLAAYYRTKMGDNCSRLSPEEQFTWLQDPVLALAGAKSTRGEAHLLPPTGRPTEPGRAQVHNFLTLLPIVKIEKSDPALNQALGIPLDLTVTLNIPPDKLTWKQIDATNENSIRAFGRILGETAAHELGHLLTLDHEFMLTPENANFLMSGTARKLRPIDQPTYTLTDRDIAFLSLYFGYADR